MNSSNVPLFIKLIITIMVLLCNSVIADTLTVRTESDSDAAEESLLSHSVYTSSSDLELVYDYQKQAVGIRFPNITIPHGSTITHAYIQFHADGRTTTTPVNLTIKGDSTDNAPAFNNSHKITTRTTTSHGTNWDNIPKWEHDNDANARQKTPDLKGIVQEIVNRSGWSSGNAIAFIITEHGNNGHNYRRAETHHGDEESPTLYIEYTSSGSSSCGGCDCSLDTSANNSSPGVAIPGLDGATADVTKCISGSSENDDKDYYHFTLQADGSLNIKTSSPNGHNYHFEVTSSKQGTLHEYDTAQDRDLTYSVSKDEEIVVKFKETGDDTDEYQATFKFDAGAMPIVENASDLCYEESNSSGMFCVDMGMCKGGMGCRNTYPLKNISNSSLSDVTALYNETGLGGSFGSSCGVDPSGTCQTVHDIDFGPVGFFGTATEYNLSNPIPPQDANNSIWAENFMSGSCLNGENLYATYVKNGVLHRGKLRQCADGSCPNLHKGDRDFTIRNPENTRNIYGNYTVIGNQNLCTDHNEDGTCVGDTKTTSNAHPSLYVDIDNNSSTVNSSSSTLVLPTGAKVVWAGLYWQGTIHNSDNDDNRYDEDFGRDDLWVQGNKIIGATNVDSGHKEIDLSENNNGHGAYNACKVELKVPGKGYVKITADQLDFYQLGYGAFADITDKLSATNPNGTYTIADIKSQTGKETSHGNYAAWSLVVIYEKDGEKLRNISVFDGYVTVNSSYNGELTMDGFLTKKTPPITSKLAFFTLDGDGGTNSLSVDDQKISNADHPEDRFFNSTINSAIQRTPDYASARVDLDYIDLVDVLQPSQTSAVLKPRSGGDRYTASYFIMSAELRTYNFCYDYTYGQNGTFQTAPSIKPARVEGTFSSDPIDVKLYFKNLENSDINIKNLQVHINPIDNNTSYKADSTYVTKPGGSQEHVTDSAETDANKDVNISIGDVGSLEYFYTYYSLNHSQQDINTSINATLTFDLTAEIGGKTLNLDNQTVKMDNLNPCQNNISYRPAPGKFNIVQDGEGKSDDPYFYFNIPTQVVGRVGNFKVESMDPNDLNKSKAGVKDQNVTVEMIDVAGFHYATASCTDQNATVVSSDSVLVVFDNNTSYTADVDKEEMRQKHFFDRAVQNAAFRIGYYEDGNTSAGRVKTCSRDNFAIRPEAYTFHFTDYNHSNPSQINPLPDNNGSTIKTIHLAAGYDYLVAIDATDHLNNAPTPGYTTSNVDVNMTWQESNPLDCNDESNITITPAFFNGTSNTKKTWNNIGKYKFYILDTQWTAVDSNAAYMDHHVSPLFKNGVDCKTNSAIVQNESSSDYNGCNISSEHNNTKSGYTQAFQNMKITYHPYKFDLNGTSGGTEITPQVNLLFSPVTNTSYVYIADINNSQDENMSYHLVGTINAVGENNVTLTNFVNKCYAVPLDIHIATSNRDLNDTKGRHVDFKVRFHDLNSSGGVIAGNDINVTDGVATSHTDDILLQTMQTATKGYFPKNLNGSMNTRLNINYARPKDATINPKALAFIQYKVKCTNAATDCTFNADLNNNKTTKGTKELNATVPVKFYYGRAHAGRHRYEVPKDAPYNANIYYEIYCYGAGCNTGLLPSTKHVNDIRWYQNTNHSTSRDGNISNVFQRDAIGKVGINNLNSTANPSKVQLTYDGSLGYPYMTTMEINASNWLIYDENNPNATANPFRVEFNKGTTGWSGKKETNTTTKASGASKTNRRTMW